MSIVTVEQLIKKLSSIVWNDEQEQIAQIVLDGVEEALEDRLYGAPISPRFSRAELAPILDSGQVATRYPVYSVSALDGTDITLDIEHPQADWWTLEKGVLWRSSAEAPLTQTYPYGGGRVPHTRNTGAVLVTYRPGWGNRPALALAILNKAADIMGETQDDSLKVRNTDGTKLPPLPPMEWSDKEIASLDTYRNLTAFR